MHNPIRAPWRAALVLGIVTLLGWACASDPDQDKPSQLRASDFRADQSMDSYHATVPAFTPDLPGGRKP